MSGQDVGRVPLQTVAATVDCKVGFNVDCISAGWPLMFTDAMTFAFIGYCAALSVDTLNASGWRTKKSWSVFIVTSTWPDFLRV